MTTQTQNEILAAQARVRAATAADAENGKAIHEAIEAELGPLTHDISDAEFDARLEREEAIEQAHDIDGVTNEKIDAERALVDLTIDVMRERFPAHAKELDYLRERWSMPKIRRRLIDTCLRFDPTA